jgi:acylglycerol lipase
MNSSQSSKDTLHDSPLESIYVENNSAEISSPKAQILLIHGMGTYAGWFKNFQNQAASKKIITHALDLPGFGKSGVRGQIDSYQQWVWAIKHTWQKIHNLQPQLPCFLLGHSLGAVLALNVLPELQPKPNGVILTAPGFAANLKSWPLFSFLLPSLYKALVNHPKKINPPFPPEVEVAVQNGQHALDDLTQAVRPKLLLEMAKAGHFAFWNYKKTEAPLLMVLPEQENFCLNGVSKQFFKNCPSADKELKIWPHLRHDLFVLPEAPEVNEHILNWVSVHHLAELKND